MPGGLETAEGRRRARLPEVAGDALSRMPWTHRILLENLVRHAAAHADAHQALERWLAGADDFELPFRPARMMMHDTTCVPALVDLAALRSVLAGRGEDPRRINPVLRVDVSTDHSLAVDAFGHAGAMRINMAAELRRNAERYGFMKWASATFDDFHVHPPGTGIMHSMNLEQLATLATEVRLGDERWLIPDTLVGTDSHTPMVNGLGVLAWGIGGLEAESVMLGAPLSIRLPRVLGVRLTGALREGVTATDLALTVTSRLRRHGVGGRFVEFFGPGVSALSAGERCVVANMAPEYGAATGYFAIDERTLAYLRQTGRDAAHVARAGAYARAEGLWFDPDAAPCYDEVVNLDLDHLAPSVAGPRRPQDLLGLAEARLSLDPVPAAGRGALPARPVAIAAITSCTNTTDPRQLIAAGLLARNARRLGLKCADWVKTSLAPGSPAAAAYLRRAGLLDELEALGFAIVGYGCTTCIGNSGPIDERLEAALVSGAARPVAVLSGNRNFPGRVHSLIEESFLASPPLVVAYALAGDFDRDIASDPIGAGQTRLSDLWPSAEEIDATLAAALRPEDFREAFGAAEANADWAALDVPTGETYPWNPASTNLRRPPFADPGVEPRLGRFTARPLLVLPDDITTDHISPAGAIPAQSDAGRWLVERGEDPADLGVFSARRGNWEVMLRGLFTNRAVRNLLAPGLAPGETVHAPSGERMPIWRAAERYAREGAAVVMVAGERYGMGSSRDWAAKGAWLLGVRAVLARSFERIHRSNLINMGIVPLVVPDALALGPDDGLEVDASAALVAPEAPIEVAVLRSSGGREAVVARAAVETEFEAQILRDGGILPSMARRH